jgi:adenylate cyclase class 2
VLKKKDQKPPRTKRKVEKSPAVARRSRLPVDVEVEVKLPCDDLSCLADAGLELEQVKARYFEDNWVYELPDGKLRKGQYLRVRYSGDGNGSGRRHEGVLTYKGKSKRESAESKRKNKGRKVREEIETSVGKPSKLVKIFKRLGLRRSFRYQKYRTIYRVRLDDERELLAMFDETPIGNFLELEGDGATIESVARRLGYRRKDWIPESYVELQHALCAKRGESFRDMVFEKKPSAPRKPAKKK